MESKKKIQVNLFPKQKETHENRTYDSQRGKEGVGWKKLGSGIDIYILLYYKIDNEQGSTV